MPQEKTVHKPVKLNRDISEKYLPIDASPYMLNTERSITAGGKLGKHTPLLSNELICEIIEQVGEDHMTVGAYRSPLTNEVYMMRFNEGGIDYILRVNPDTTCEVVYQGNCLDLSPDPERYISQWRCYLKVEDICAHRHGKTLIFVDGSDNDIFSIDVEASIETDSFTTPFFALCPDPCAHVKLRVPQPCGAPQGEYMVLRPEDKDLSNQILDVGIQLMYQQVYYDGRTSEWSDISTLFFQDSKGCFEVVDGFPRCIKLRVPLGNPMVDRIRIAYRTNNNPQWNLYDTIEKYEAYTSDDQKWYERALKVLPGYNASDCEFDYVFCNDKQSTPIDLKETARTTDRTPRAPQGFFPIKDSLAFYNYVKGNCPLIDSETKKIQVALDCEGDANGCTQEFVDVNFFLIVHNPEMNKNMPIYRMGGEYVTDIDDPKDRAYFGGIGGTGDLPAKPAYHQYFTGDTRNFIAYVEGTDYAVEMVQWKADPNFINRVKIGRPLANMDDEEIVSNFQNNTWATDKFHFQKGTLRVPKGTSGFIRIANHKERSGLGDSQNTSTTIAGTIPTLYDYNGRKNINGILSRSDELYFNTCGALLPMMDILETFVVNDYDTDNGYGGASHSASSYSGYVRDTDGNPIEGAEIWTGESVGGNLRDRTDHNGFYHFYFHSGTNDAFSCHVRVEKGAGEFITVHSFMMPSAYGHMTLKDLEVDDEAYRDGYYQNVAVPVKKCDNTPLPGIRVALSGSKYKVTDENGVATFKARNNSTRNRVVQAVVMDFKHCFSLGCDGSCNPCMPYTILGTLLPSEYPAFPDPDAPMELELSTGLNTDSDIINKAGLKAGGRYGWGVVAKGNGRVSSVYPITLFKNGVAMLDNYLSMPRTQEKGEVSFCGFDFNATGIVLPSWVECLSIVRTDNKFNYVLQWVIDKIEPVGNKLKITLQSLVDYNIAYNFKANTNYQFVEGDRVEFIKNGRGEIFSSATYGILNYKILSPFHDKIISGQEDPEANFFNQILIESDATLDKFKLEDLVGSVIELLRPKVSDEANTPFFEIGVTLPVGDVGGIHTVIDPIGSFSTFDTYLVSRSIASLAPQYFEHRNPSDFWGEPILGISDVGRVHFENKFENERRYDRNFTITAPAQFNRFGDLEKTLDGAEQGGIVSVGTYDGKVGVAIGEFDNFIFQISDDFLRVGSDGVVRAAPADSLISDAQPKVKGIFGCQYEDIGSILYGDGFITWVDSLKGAYVTHNFSEATDISYSQMQSWLRPKIQRIKTLNSTAVGKNKMRWITGFNFHTNAIQLTAKALSGLTINNNQDALLADGETILFDPRSGEFLTFASYLQDSYSNIEFKDAKGCAFISTVGNKIYRHPIVGASYNMFNGVACDWCIGIVINENPGSIKVPLALEVQSEQMFYVTKVETDKVGFLSEIPPIRFRKTERKWNAAFLYNKNSRGGLYGIDATVAGEPARGYWIKMMLVRDNTDALKYGTIDFAKRTAYGELDLVLVKMFFSEQAGFQGNV